MAAKKNRGYIRRLTGLSCAQHLSASCESLSLWRETLAELSGAVVEQLVRHRGCPHLPVRRRLSPPPFLLLLPLLLQLFLFFLSLLLIILLLLLLPSSFSSPPVPRCAASPVWLRPPSPPADTVSLVSSVQPPGAGLYGPRCPHQPSQ